MEIEVENKYDNMRKRFRANLIPRPHTSNDYFFQAALLCKEEGLSETETMLKISKIYDEWVDSDSFSGRKWEEIEKKVWSVYS